MLKISKLDARHCLVGAASLLLIMALAGCMGGYVSPEAIDPPAGQFTRATTSFVKDARQNILTTYRREVRRDFYTQMLKTYLETRGRTPTQFQQLVAANTPETFLCKAEYGYGRVALRLGNLDALGTVLGDRLQQSSDDLGTLITALGTNYAINTKTKDIEPTYDSWLAKPEGVGCKNAIASADPFATRSYVGEEFLPAAIPAGIAAIDTIWTVLKPIAVGVLKNTDIERRNQAIVAYFRNQANVDKLKADLIDTEKFLDNEFKLEQQRTAGRAVVTATTLFDANAAHWKKIVEIANTAKCQQALPVLAVKETRTSPDGVACMNDALSAAAAPLEQALNAADAFDIAIGKQVPEDADRLSAQVDTLQKIALGQAPADEKVKALWAASLRYYAFFQTADAAVSAANQKKVSDAIDAFVKTVK